MNDKNISILFRRLALLITDTDVVFDSIIEKNDKLGYPVYINGGAGTLWFKFASFKNTLMVNSQIGHNSLLPINAEFEDIVQNNDLLLVICNTTREVNLVLTQLESENIVIPITDIEEKKYNLVNMESLFFYLAKAISNNL